MPVEYTIHHSPVYQVATPVYEGPLDLLLQLIERAELDITCLALAQVTDQFLEHIRILTDLSPDEISGFLVIAARLIQIKSEALLPRPPIREPGEEDPGEALARQLILYRQYKNIAEWLNQRQQIGFRSYLRLVPHRLTDGHVDLEGLGLVDLLEAAANAYARTLESPESLRSVITPPHVTIRQKIMYISQSLQRDGHASFRNLLKDAYTRLEIVVTFLAVLELVKQHFVLIHQTNLFSDFEIEPSKDWKDSPEFELEFGE